MFRSGNENLFLMSDGSHQLDGKIYRDGFLVLQKVKYSSLQTEDVKPTLDEIRTFQNTLDGDLDDTLT